MLSRAQRAEVRDVDHGWRDLLKTAGDLARGRTGKVGVLADTEAGGLHEVDPVTGKASALTVAEIAAVLEYGTEDGQIPSRPAVRVTFDEQREELAARAGKLLLGVLDRKVTVDQALGVLGSTLAAEIKKKITTGGGMPPPNAPSTIAKKGSDRPLVDTGRLVGAITWQVEP